MIREELLKILIEVLVELGIDIDTESVLLDWPTEAGRGEFTTNVAMVYAKKLGKNPRELAEEILKNLEAKAPSPSWLKSMEVAGAGFINFYLKDEVFAENLKVILREQGEYGKNKTLAGKKVMIEYTDPNPFKPFHIGHLMTNAIGESLARIIEFSGAEVFRANYQGDVGRHVAMAVWGLQKKGWTGGDVAQNGEAYVYGNEMFENDELAKKEIIEINKYLYESLGSNKELDEIYNLGKKTSLEHFDDLYKKLGTKFDHFFFESQTWSKGKKTVEENIGKVFEKSDGAVIFDGEKYGLHKRVFINSEGLTTYEAKDIGLAFLKEEEFDADTSIIITAVEQKEYFNVVYKALEQIAPDVAKKNIRIMHGMMQFADGKMSSRKGNVITGENLLESAQDVASKKMSESDTIEAKDVAEKIAVSAIKYAILKQSIGKNIIYNPESALSFEGDSGPYLQYTYARIQSVLEKGGVELSVENAETAGSLERILYKFPGVVERAYSDYSPSTIATYLIQLSQEFNSYYANNKIADDAYRLAVASAVSIVLKNGLHLLGIKTVDKM